MGLTKQYRERLSSHVYSMAKKRWGVILFKSDQKRIIRMIRNGETVGVNLKKDFFTLHVVYYKGMNLPVVYNSIANVLHTVLPWNHKTLLENFGDIRNGQKGSIPATGNENIIQ